MNLPDWNKIKDEVYYWDGSWRDIYVLDSTQEDWDKWIELINQNYQVEFNNGRTEQKEDRINKQVVFDYWAGNTNLLNNATIKIGNIIIKCYFFTEHEIENDIDPREIVTADEHKMLLDYLISVSNALSKRVVLTAESQPESIYLSVHQDDIQINIS